MIPAELYSDNVLSEEPVDNTGTFIKECGHNHFFMDNFTEGRTFEISYPDDDDDDDGGGCGGGGGGDDDCNSDDDDDDDADDSDDSNNKISNSDRFHSTYIGHTESNEQQFFYKLKVIVM